jgi:ABC-type antimicrobial peptide transport system permease subunit
MAARRLYPHGSAVGHMIKLGAPARDGARWVRVIGVSRNATMIDGQSSAPAPTEVYVASPDRQMMWGTVYVRAEREDPRITVDIKRKLHAIANVWVFNAQPFSWRSDGELRSRVFLAKVFVTMGTVALSLAALGLYGVLAYAVGQRMREFAVRLALGAQPVQLFRMVMHDGAVMILAGTGIGAFGALAASRLLDAVLEQVLPSDVISLLACEIILMACGFLAAYLPARRAVKANPLDILRAV